MLSMTVSIGSYGVGRCVETGLGGASLIFRNCNDDRHCGLTVRLSNVGDLLCAEIEL